MGTATRRASSAEIESILTQTRGGSPSAGAADDPCRMDCTTDTACPPHRTVGRTTSGPPHVLADLELRNRGSVRRLLIRLKLQNRVGTGPPAPTLGSSENGIDIPRSAHE